MLGCAPYLSSISTNVRWPVSTAYCCYAAVYVQRSEAIDVARVQVDLVVLEQRHGVLGVAVHDCVK